MQLVSRLYGGNASSAIAGAAASPRAIGPLARDASLREDPRRAWAWRGSGLRLGGACRRAGRARPVGTAAARCPCAALDPAGGCRCLDEGPGAIADGRAPGLPVAIEH